MSGISNTIWRSLERVGLARRRIDFGDLPSEGRSSVPTFQGSFSSLTTSLVSDYITPAIPFDLTEALERAAVYNPDISMAVSKFRSLANSGHKVVLEGSDNKVEAAIKILNEAAYRIYQRSAGVDGLVNHLLDQVIITGAVCAEDVVDLSKWEVREVAVVPTTTIRFKHEEGRLVPYQKVSNLPGGLDMVPLNETTFAMYAAQVFRDSPYPKSPMTAVLEPLIMQRASMQNIEFILRKVGLLGLIRVALAIPPQKPGESESKYEARKKQFLDSALKAFADNFRQGVIVAYKDFEILHDNVTGDARGAKDVFQVVEEQMAAGMDIDPAMLGRSYSTTETYAGVVYGCTVKSSQTYQRMVRRRVERTYRLELQLKGVEVDSLSVPFNEIPARDPQAEAQAEATRIASIITKAEKGMIDPDQAAQEAGYDAWFDIERLTSSGGGLPFAFSRPNKKAFIFDSASNRYRFIRPSIRVRLASKESEAARRLEEALKGYQETMGPYLDQARIQAMDRAIDLLEKSSPADFPEAEAFARSVLAEIQAEYVVVMSSPQVREGVKAYVAEGYAAFKLGDLTAWRDTPPISFLIGEWDKRTTDWMSQVDNFFFSKFVDNDTMKNPIQGFLKEQFLEHGEGLLGRTSPDTIKKFRELFDDKLASASDNQVKNIVSHSVQRQRNWAHAQQMREAEVEEAEIVAVIDNRTSDVCLLMDGKRIPVAPAMNALDKVLELSPEQYLGHLQEINPDDYYTDHTPAQAAADGRGWPPYHPGPCRTRVVAVIK